MHQICIPLQRVRSDLHDLTLTAFYIYTSPFCYVTVSSNMLFTVVVDVLCIAIAIDCVQHVRTYIICLLLLL